MNTPITIQRQIFMVRIFLDRCGELVIDQLKDPGPAPKNDVSHAKVNQADTASTYSDASSQDSSLGDDSSSESSGPPGDDSASEADGSNSGLGGLGSL